MGSMDLNGQVWAFLGSCKEEWVFVKKYLLKVWVLWRVCFFYGHLWAFMDSMGFHRQVWVKIVSQIVPTGYFFFF